MSRTTKIMLTNLRKRRRADKGIYLGFRSSTEIKEADSDFISEWSKKKQKSICKGGKPT